MPQAGLSKSSAMCELLDPPLFPEELPRGVSKGGAVGCAHEFSFTYLSSFLFCVGGSWGASALGIYGVPEGAARFPTDSACGASVGSAKALA